MLVKSRNMWGTPGGLESQRGDLWVLDLEEVLRQIQRSSTLSTSVLRGLPANGQTLHYARSVSFPEARIADVEVRTGNTPKMYPGFDESVGGVRVDFILDADEVAIGSSGRDGVDV
jgi:hypothetical protein